MRIIIVEYVLADGLAGHSLEAVLLNEAREMVAALIEDITQTPGLEVSVAVGFRIAHDIAPKLRITRRNSECLAAFWRRAAHCGDAVLPVAPETGGALELLTRLLADSGVPVLGCRTEAITLAASKHKTASLLQSAGVPVVTTLRPATVPKVRSGDWVIKPDDGVSCTGMRLLGTTEDPSTFPSGAVLQPWLRGTAASLCLLCDASGARVLSVNRQIIRRAGIGFIYCGSDTAAFPLQTQHHQLAAAVYQAIPGLYGFVGIDLIINDEALTVLEVNPRLTTSCVGLRKGTGIGLGTRILDLLTGLPMIAEADT